MDHAIYPVHDLELRQRDRTITGSFRYGELATIADRGRVRKERIAPRAFRFSVENADREVNLLSGHSFQRPIASKRAKSLELSDTPDALEFAATLPVEAEQTSWMQDVIKSIRAGLVGGISPGFRIPPATAVETAQRLIPEPGNPGVFIREILEAVLVELSLVARPAYPATEIALRHDGEPIPDLRRYLLWL